MPSPPSISHGFRFAGRVLSGAGLLLAAGLLDAAEAISVQLRAESPPAAVLAKTTQSVPQTPNPTPIEIKPTDEAPARSTVSQKLHEKLMQKFPHDRSRTENNGSTTPKDGDTPAIVMPTLIVREAKIRELSKEDVLAEDKFSKLSRKVYLGTDYGALKRSEDKRLAQIKEIQGMTLGTEGKQRLQEAVFRKSDPITDALDKAANNGRR